VNDFAQSVQTAIALIVHADATLLHTVLLSLGVSGAACLLASGFGLVAAPGSRSRGFQGIVGWYC